MFLELFASKDCEYIRYFEVNKQKLTFMKVQIMDELDSGY